MNEEKINTVLNWIGHLFLGAEMFQYSALQGRKMQSTNFFIKNQGNKGQAWEERRAEQEKGGGVERGLKKEETIRVQRY